VEYPRHLGLLTSAASGFTSIPTPRLQEEADEVEPHDFAAAEAMRLRARHLYLRAQGYGMPRSGSEAPRLRKSFAAIPRPPSARPRNQMCPLLYWTAAAWASAISLSKDNPELVGQIPAMEPLMDRALELDESFGNGAIHTFMISYEMTGRARVAIRRRARAKHFERPWRCPRKPTPRRWSPWRRRWTVQKQDVKEFESLLNQALQSILMPSGPPLQKP